MDSPHDRHINHVRDGAGSEVLSHRLTSLLPSLGVRQTGPSAVKVSMYYISRTRSWAKPTIWLPSPPIGLIIHTGAQLHGEPRGVCSRSLSTFRTEVGRSRKEILFGARTHRICSVAGASGMRALAVGRLGPRAQSLPGGCLGHIFIGQIAAHCATSCLHCAPTPFPVSATGTTTSWRSAQSGEETAPV